MKVSVIICLFLASCLIAFAGPDMTTPFTIASVATNTSANYTGGAVTNGVYVSSWIDAVLFDWTDSGGQFSQTATVSVVTLGGTGSGPSRTILTLTAGPCTDASYFPRASGCGTTGTTLTTAVGERIPLIQDWIIVSAHTKTQTNTTAVTVRVVLSPAP